MFKTKYFVLLLICFTIIFVFSVETAQTQSGDEPVPILPINVPPYRILFEFDPELSAAQVDQSAIVLETLDGTPIPGEVIFESGYATFVPSVRLDYDTTYIVRVKPDLGEARSVSGMSQESSAAWTFTTESLQAVGPLVYHSYTIDDDNTGDSSGNGDGDVDPGETIQLRVFLGNSGESTASSVNGSISSTDPNISFPGITSSGYNDILGYGTQGNNSDFLFFVDPGATCGYQLPFNIDASAAGGISSQDSFAVPVSCNAPAIPANPTPAQGSTGASLNPDLGVTVSDLDSDQLTVTFYGREKIMPAADDFEFIIIPDTQYYSCNGNLLSCPPLVPNINDGRITTFISQTQWIVGNQASIAYAPHMGDLVQNANWFEQEWINGNSAMDVLETGAPQIPYGISPGNHDLRNLYGVNPEVTGDTFLNQYFGVDRFNGRSYYGGHFSFNNNNYYVLFQAGGLQFIGIHIEYSREYDDALLAWTDSLIKQYPTRRAIVVRHALIDQDGNFVEGGDLYYQTLRENPNLFLMLSGHIDGEFIRSDAYNNGTVYTILSDYQNEPNGGDGWLRQLKFSPQDAKITVRSYTPLTDRWDWENPLATGVRELSYDMSYRTVEVGKQSGVSSGSTVSVPWNGLLPDTNYEWYAAVSDGVNTTISPVWNFTTGACYPLALGSTSSGGPPTALPANSDGCPVGEYAAGETIELTAHPAVGHHVSGWTGTQDDASFDLTNQLVMPAGSHTVLAHYEQDLPSCRTLSLGYTGSGDVPTASPTNSKDCSVGNYLAGETIDLSAHPALGHHVSGWSGTADDASVSLTNRVVMPAEDHEVVVHYEEDFMIYLPAASKEGN